MTLFIAKFDFKFKFLEKCRTEAKCFTDVFYLFCPTLQPKVLVQKRLKLKDLLVNLCNLWFDLWCSQSSDTDIVTDLVLKKSFKESEKVCFERSLTWWRQDRCLWIIKFQTSNNFHLNQPQPITNLLHKLFSSEFK